MKGEIIIYSCVLLLIFSSCVSEPFSPDLDLAVIKDGRSGGISSHAPWGSNADRLQHIQPGETAVIFDVKGYGVINHIWLTFNDARHNWLE